MDFVVKLGENGIAFPYINISPQEKVSFLQEKIYSDAKIEIKDQILFTKKGHKLHPDHIFASLEKENNFQATMCKGESMTKPTFAIYVFDQKKMSNEHKNSSRDRTPYFMENNEDLRDYLSEAKIIDKDYTSSFQSQTIDPTVIESVKRVNPDLLNIENRLFSTYLWSKKKLLQYEAKSRKVERLLKESENQLQTFDVLLKYASTNYNPCKVKKNEVHKRFQQNQDRNEHTLKKFEGSLEELRKIELHDALKTEKQKHLSDIYFSREAMFKWRNSCVEFQNNIKTKIDKYSTIIKAIKKKLKDERDQTINLVLGQFQTQANGIDTATQEGESQMLSVFMNTYEDYKALREALEAFTHSPVSNEDRLTNSRWKELESKISDEESAVCDDFIQRLDKILDQLIKMKINFESQILNFYKFIMKCAGELNMIMNDRMKHINDEIDKLEKEFSYLLNPSLLPGAYHASLVEVSRRRSFANKFEKKSKKLQSLVDGEKDQRKKFLSQFGRILPGEFIPQLKLMPPILNIENSDTDSSLPKIENYHNSKNSDGLTPGENSQGSKVDRRYIDDLEKINRDCKQEIQRLKEENDIKPLKRKYEELMREFDNEKEKHKVLKAKMHDLERDKLTKSEINRENAVKEHEHQSLKEEFDHISKLTTGVLSSVGNIQENQMIGSKSGKENNGHYSEKHLLNKINILTTLIQQVSKSSFEVFSRKLSEKQKNYDESRMKYENLLMKAEEDVQRQGTYINLQYEEKMQDLNLKYSEAQKRIGGLLDELKKSQRDLAELKNETQEKNRSHHQEVEQVRKDIKGKLDLLRSKDEVIKQLSEGRAAQSKQIAEFKEQMEQFEQKVKLEHSEVLTNIHNLHRTDIEKLKDKIKNLENSMANKATEIEKAKSAMVQEQKEGKKKEEKIQKLESDFERLNEKYERAQKELKDYYNKVENMEIVIRNKTTDIEEKERKVQELSSEKKSLTDDLSTYKQFNGELNQKFMELRKRRDTEKNSFKEENETLVLEVEKKKVEINNLNAQIEKVSRETKSQIESLSKLTEDQNIEKSRITSLNEELNEKIIEVTTLKTKNELFSLDLENKVKENICLNQKLELIKMDNDKLGNDLEAATDALAAERNTIRDLKQKIEDIKTVNEQFRVEGDIKKKRCIELEKNIKELNEQIAKSNEGLSELKAENELLQKQSDDKESRNEMKIQELTELIVNYDKEISQKNEEIDKLSSSKSDIQEELSKIKEQFEQNARILKEKESSLKALEGEAKNNDSINSELEKQAGWYKEEIKVKQQEIEKLREENDVITQNLERANTEHSILTSELESHRERIESLITQNKREVEEQIQKAEAVAKQHRQEIEAQKQQKQSIISQHQELLATQKKQEETSVTLYKREIQEQKELLKSNTEMYNQELCSKLDYLRVEKGARVLFIPYSSGVYVPFSLHQYTQEEINSVLKTGLANLDKNVFTTIEKSVKTNFFLDLDCLSQTYQDILRDFSLLIVGTVKNITQKVNKDVNPDKESLMVEIEKIDYMMGFDDEEENLLKNYIQ